jgi:hypothetical protein
VASSPFGVTLESVWADYRRCALRTHSLKGHLDRTRKIALLLVTVSAVLGVLSAQLPESYSPSRILAFLTAISAAVATYMTSHLLSLGIEREWVLCRAVAEALKSEAFRFMARAQPYDAPDRATNDEVLSQKAADYRDRVSLGAFLKLPEGNLLERLPEDWLSMPAYLNVRVWDAIKWYQSKAAHAATRANALTWVTIVLGGLAAALGAAHGVNQDLRFLTAWIAVITSISGSVTTYLFANRYRALVQSYETAALRLERLVGAWDRVREQDRPSRASEFVNQFEEVMLVENKQWVAEFDKPGGGQGEQPAK